MSQGATDDPRRARDLALSKLEADLARVADGDQVAGHLRGMRERNHFAEQIIAAMSPTPGGKR